MDTMFADTRIDSMVIGHYMSILSSMLLFLRKNEFLNSLIWRHFRQTESLILSL